MLHFFEVAGKLLPAIGFAMLLKQSLSRSWMIVLFLMGWGADRIYQHVCYGSCDIRNRPGIYFCHGTGTACSTGKRLSRLKE